LVFVIGCEKEDIKQDLEVPEEPEKFQKQSSYTKKYVDILEKAVKAV